ncbi:hypothetical protein ACFPM7_03955 [Actinokineospora guangxiensis]|uniref:Uncharacterized protein n=1 Tax=Actinokineospora guangxiensis TaxID=1490288 RepID=A0ABW0EGU6_9PSEU
MAQKKIKGTFGIVSAVASATSAVSTLKTARSDKDKLALANAIGSIIVAVTGVLIAVRAFRDDK